MNHVARLLLLTAEGALITSLGCFLLALPFLKAHFTPIGEEVGGIVLGFLPSGLAGWWIFRRLRSNHPRVEARGAAITFSVFALAGLAIGLFLGEIFGGYAGSLLGDRFSFPGALVGIVATIDIVTFPPVLAALWIARRVAHSQPGTS
jgi:hypothetical protein